MELTQGPVVFVWVPFTIAEVEFKRWQNPGPNPTNLQLQRRRSSRLKSVYTQVK
jgi:hypothetical protein